MSRLDRKKGKKKKNKKVVPVGPSVEEVQESMAAHHEGITTAASYSERVKEKRAQSEGMKGKGMPLGGAPPLDPNKMKKLARGLAPKPSFEDDEPSYAETDQDEPQEDAPSPMGGVGSAYPVNQAMAQGKIKKPVSMREAKDMTEAQNLRGKRKPLSQKSIDALEAAAEAQEKEAQEKEEESSHPLGDRNEDDLDQADRELERGVGDLFNYGAIQEQQRVLLDSERREKIEEGLEPLTIEDMIMKREIQQTITVIPGKLMYTLRTFNQKEHLFCLQYVYDHPGSVIYNEEFLNTCKLVCALVSVNGAHLPKHSKDGDVDKDAFEKKMSHVASFPTQLIADLSVQTIWFNDRVTKLFSLENLKNG